MTHYKYSTFIDVDLENLSFSHHLPAFAVLTSVLRVDRFSLASAAGASSLRLGHESGSQLLNADFDSASTAGAALLHRSGLSSNS